MKFKLVKIMENIIILFIRPIIKIEIAAITFQNGIIKNPEIGNNNLWEPYSSNLKFLNKKILCFLFKNFKLLLKIKLLLRIF